MKRFFTLLISIAIAGTANAQFSIDAYNTTYTQDFSGMGTSAGTWTNGSAPITGWYSKTDATASITTYGVNTGSTTTAGLYCYGVAGTNALSDRSLGYAASNAFFGAAGSGKAYMGLRLKNNTGGTITSLVVTYDGEQWRKENNASTNVITVEYQTATTVTDLTAGTWTTAGAGLTFTSPIVGATTAAALDGNAGANRVADLTATINFGTAVPNGDEIMIRFVDLNDSGNDHMLTIDNVRVTADGALPISLVSFTAQKLAEKVKISWATATEINNDKFIVERSVNGEEYEFISEVNGAGNSKEINKYELVDNSPLKGTSYYRLTQIDYNGQSQTFAPVSVKMDVKGIELTASSTEQGAIGLNIYSPSAGEATLFVRDLSGRTIVSEKVILTEGYQNFNINSHNFNSGIHLIQLMNGAEVVVKKLIL